MGMKGGGMWAVDKAATKRFSVVFLFPSVLHVPRGLSLVQNLLFHPRPLFAFLLFPLPLISNRPPMPTSTMQFQLREEHFVVIDVQPDVIKAGPADPTSPPSVVRDMRAFQYFILVSHEILRR